MTPAISVAGLSRRYRGQLALDDITFDIEPGSITGLLTLIAAQVAALTAVVLIIGGTHDWHGVGRFFTTLTIGGLTGLLAALTVVLLAGGYAIMRRVTV
jgi:ABC-type branched-subunit amino acid transport system ATPase component